MRFSFSLRDPFRRRSGVDFAQPCTILDRGDSLDRGLPRLHRLGSGKREVRSVGIDRHVIMDRYQSGGSRPGEKGRPARQPRLWQKERWQLRTEK